MLSSRILKGGALLSDSRVVVESWNMSIGAEKNLGRMLSENVLAKRSRNRAKDVLYKVLRQRFVDAGPDIIPALKELLDHPRAFTEACYYEASRADELLAEFAEGPLWQWFTDGRFAVTAADTVRWIDGLLDAGRLPSWSEQVRGRVARGLVSATRDFGVLGGSVRKQFNVPRLSPAGFSYVAYRLHEQGVAARGLIDSPIWRRWLLRPPDVDQLFAEAAHLGVLRRSRAGSMVRFDWEAPSLVEVAHAVA